MDRARWRDLLGPPIALLMPAVLIAAESAAATPALAAGFRLDEAGACATVTPVTAARAAQSPPSRALPVPHVDPVLGARGELAGRSLTASTATGRSVAVSLPVESSVSTAVGSVVVYTRHTVATGSEVRALNLESGCDTLLAKPPEIVRGATLDPSKTAVYVHSVTRASRQDAGVARYDLSSGASRIVVPALASSSEFGPIFGTDLRWSLDGSSLAVQSCGFSRCRTRVLDVASGALATFAGRGQGAFIALTKSSLITFGDCLGLPCPVLSADRATGAVTVLADEAYSASVTESADGRVAATIETSRGTDQVTP